MLDFSYIDFNKIFNKKFEEKNLGGAPILAPQRAVSLKMSKGLGILQWVQFIISKCNNPVQVPNCQVVQ